MSSNDYEDVEIEWVWDPDDLDPAEDSPGDETPVPDPANDGAFRVKAWHIVFLLVLVAASIALAWWQWSRFQSGSGTFQNLGYAFQWPLFGIFFIYAYRMIVKYENKARSEKRRTGDPDFVYEADTTEFDEDGNPLVTEIDEDFLPSRPQLDVDEFNRLNQPRRGRDSDAGPGPGPASPRTTDRKHS